MLHKGTIYQMTVRSLWGYLIARGYKKCENRYAGFDDDILNKPITLTVSSTDYNEKTRHEYYDLSVVQECLQLDDATKDIHNNYKQLDAFFAPYKGCAIAIVFIDKIVRPENDTNLSMCKFANVPKQTKKVWIIREVYMLPTPITNVKGNLGVREMTNTNAMDIIRSYLSNIVCSNLNSAKHSLSSQTMSDTGPLYNARNIKSVIDHKLDDKKHVHFECQIKKKINGRLNATQFDKKWIDSSDSAQINTLTIARSGQFVEYFTKNGCNDWKTFEKNQILEASGNEKPHYFLKGSVMFNDNETKIASIEINENLPRSIFKASEGIDTKYFIEATRNSKVFPPKDVDDICMSFVYDSNKGRHTVDNKRVSVKYIEWDSSVTKGTGKNKNKNVLKPYKSGKFHGVMFYTSKYAVSAGYIDEEAVIINDDKSNKNDDKSNKKNINNDKKTKISQNDLSRTYMSSFQAASYLAHSEAMQIPEDEESDKDKEFIVRESDENTFINQRASTPYIPNDENNKYSQSDDKSSDQSLDQSLESSPNTPELNRLREDVKFYKKQSMKYKSKYQDERTANNKLTAYIDKLRRNNNKLTKQIKSQRRKGTKYDNWYSSPSSSKSREYRHKKKRHQKHRHRSPSSSPSTSPSSSASSSPSYKNKKKSKKHRKKKNNKHHEKDNKKHHESRYNTNSIWKLIRVHAYWKKSEETNVSLSKYALNYDKENDLPPACNDSNDLCAVKKLLKYCQAHKIYIPKHDKLASLNKFAAKNLSIGCQAAQRSVSMNSKVKCPPDSIFIDKDQDDNNNDNNNDEQQ